VEKGDGKMMIGMQGETRDLVRDQRIERIEELVSPEKLLEELPLGAEREAAVVRGRGEVGNVLDGADDRVLVVVGPCSVHDPEAGIVPPASEIDELLSTAVGTPPHELASPFGDATTRPAGRFCVNPTPDRPVSEFGFDTVNSSAVVAPSGIDDTPNALAIVGGRPRTASAMRAAVTGVSRMPLR